jgi:preprotein translocase subunit SecD
MEVEADGIQDNGPVEVGRDHPIIVNVDKEPFMDGEFLDSAELLDDAGGLFEIRLKFNWQGSALLNQQTSSFPGKRVAVYCAFGHGQSKNFYIASPKIDRPILNGVLTFTPAVTHDEAERIVRGLNNVSKALKKDNAFP